MGLGMKTISRQALHTELWEGVKRTPQWELRRVHLLLGGLLCICHPLHTQVTGRRTTRGTACFLHISLTLHQVQCHMALHKQDTNPSIASMV